MYLTSVAWLSLHIAIDCDKYTIHNIIFIVNRIFKFWIDGFDI